MNALDAAFEVWDGLAAAWIEYFQTHFAIEPLETAQSFEQAMDRTTDNCRKAPGFEDFVSDQARGVEPGSPAASFLYHAFASPSVRPAGLADSQYLTEPQLDAIENYVFARARGS